MKEQLKKYIIDYTGETEQELQANFDMHYQEVCSAWNSECQADTGLNIDDVSSGDCNYWTMVSFYSGKIRKMIIIDNDFYFGANLNEFIDEMLKLKDKADLLEDKLPDLN